MFPTRVRPFTTHEFRGDTTDVAVKIRLKRLGKVRVPQYRIVVVDSRKKRDGRVLEEIGLYHPKEEPSLIKVTSERAQYWLGVGAQPSEAVAKILRITGDWQTFKGIAGTDGTLRTAEAKRSKQDVFNDALKEAGGEATGEAVTKKAAAKKTAKKAAAKSDDKADEKADDKAEAKADDKADAKADEKADEKADDKAEARPTTRPTPRSTRRPRRVPPRPSPDSRPRPRPRPPKPPRPTPSRAPDARRRARAPRPGCRRQPRRRHRAATSSCAAGRSSRCVCTPTTWAR